MSKVYLGLGSNTGEKSGRIEHALQRLTTFITSRSMRLSSLYLTPALLPGGAPPSWNLPFLNLVAEIDFQGTPQELLAITQKLELEAGRDHHERWSPRPLDIDILFWEGLKIQTPQIKIPHPEMHLRAFVLDPLAELAPDLILPGQDLTVLQLARRHPLHVPRLMGILNLTPDSFSDGSSEQSLNRIESRLQNWEAHQVAIVDIGGESTRPKATPVTTAEEWARIEPTIALLRKRYAGRLLRPLISVDTRNSVVAQKALEYGADIINDVSGLLSPETADLLCRTRSRAILMHSLTVPADPEIHLSTDQPATDQVFEWMTDRIRALEAKGVSRQCLWLDPGIGFGKTSLQSIDLLRNISRLYDLNLPVVAGHSRKSYQKDFSSADAKDRDPETLGASVALVEKGVDILRVHDPVLHRRVLFSRSQIL